LKRPVQLRRPSTLPLPYLRSAIILAPAAPARAEARITDWPQAASRP
jgi:hypothetical protein